MPTFDVFLSHNSLDKPWAIKLKEDLWRYGVSVWLDKDEIRPGDLFARALEEGLVDSRAVALIVSPEAMASGWVEEEYYRALSLAKKKTDPLILIPVILRQADVPGFVESRNWVDFRDEVAYADNVWKLVWGITGQKPPEVLTVTAPPPPPVLPRPDPPAESAAPPAPSGFRSGGVKAGGKIEAKNIVTGVQVQGGDAKTARQFLELAGQMQSGPVEATLDIIAENIVTGFQYLGQSPGEPTLAQFRQELAAVQTQLAEAIAAGEFADEYDAEDAQKAVERASAQAEAAEPAPDKVAQQLERATTLIGKAAETAQAAGKFGATVIKLAPVVAGLSRLVQYFFG